MNEICGAGVARAAAEGDALALDRLRRRPSPQDLVAAARRALREGESWRQRQVARGAMSGAQAAADVAGLRGLLSLALIAAATGAEILALDPPERGGRLTVLHADGRLRSYRLEEETVDG